MMFKVSFTDLLFSLNEPYMTDCCLNITPIQANTFNLAGIDLNWSQTSRLNYTSQCVILAKTDRDDRQLVKQTVLAVV